MNIISIYYKVLAKYKCFPILSWRSCSDCIFLLITIFDGREGGREGGCLVVADDRTDQGRAQSSLTTPWSVGLRSEDWQDHAIDHPPALTTSPSPRHRHHGTELDHDHLRAAEIPGGLLQVRHHRHIRSGQREVLTFVIIYSIKF